MKIAEITSLNSRRGKWGAWYWYCEKADRCAAAVMALILADT